MTLYIHQMYTHVPMGIYRPTKDVSIILRVTADDRERWRKAARRAGLPLSAWLRAAADAATKAGRK